MKLHKGFTRIDLTVTLLCAAFLVVTLGAVGNRGRRRAQQLVCASQLGKWGQAIFMHSADNDDKIMKMIKRFFDSIYLSCYVSTIENYPSNVPDTDTAQPDEWNAYSINPYAPVLDADYANNGTVTPMVVCPSGSYDFMQKWIMNANWQSDFIEIGYCYWAGIDEVPRGSTDIPAQQPLQRSENALRYLTMDVLSSKRLLMSDILWLIPTIGEYRYNHGIDGWSWSTWVADIHGDVSPKATGRNQLFGDGRVIWKPIPPENNLPTLEDQFFEQNNGMWNGPDSGWVGDQWDTSYF